MQLYVLSLVDHTHTTTTQFLDDAVMRDGLADHWRESYVGETGKSMKAVGLAPSRKVVVETSRLHSRQGVLSVNVFTTAVRPFPS